MDIRLLPFFELAENNKRKNYKEDLLDGVVHYTKVGGDSFDDFDLFKYSKFCRFDGVVEDLWMLFVGNHYNVYKL